VPSHGPLILLVEDDAAHGELIQRAFKDLRPDYRLQLADSLRGARQRIEQATPGLVITDLVLPDGRGTELIPAEPELASYPVMVLTSRGDEQTAVGALKSGALDYIVKSEATLKNLPLLADRIMERWENQVERRRAEQALRDSEARFRLLAENAADIVFRREFQPRPRFVYVSPAVTAILGYSPREHYADPDILNRVVHPEDRHLLAAAQRDPGKLPQSTTLRCITKDGSVVWLESRLAPVYDAAGELVAIEGVARDISHRKQAEDALRARERDLQELASQLSAAEDQERRRLAMDIHDSIGQRLSLLKLNLERTRSSWQGDAPLATVLDDCLRLLGESIKQARSLTFDLYPAMLDDLGLAPTLQWFGREFAAQTGIRFRVEETGVPRPLPATLAGYLFRAFKELLNNVAKHAHAREVVLDINWRKDRLALSVCDDGSGFPDSTKPSDAERPGLGLRSIRERITFLGGRFQVKSKAGQGSRVSLEVLLHPSTPLADTP
jgi:PAS domain S-box-containing protein